MKTKHTTMPAREYYGDNPLWTPYVYYRLFTAQKPQKKTLMQKIVEALKW